MLMPLERRRRRPSGLPPRGVWLAAEDCRCIRDVKAAAEPCDAAALTAATPLLAPGAWVCLCARTLGTCCISAKVRCVKYACARFEADAEDGIRAEWVPFVVRLMGAAPVLIGGGPGGLGELGGGPRGLFGRRSSPAGLAFTIT